jgi:hypothetical protein
MNVLCLALMKQVASDRESSRRHWNEVLETANELLEVAAGPGLAWGPRVKKNAETTKRIATAALSLIERTGHGPRSIVLAEAAAELGVSL